MDANDLRQVRFWPIILVCFFALSPGGIMLAGVPRIAVTTAIVGLWMFWSLRGQADISAVRFCTALVVAMVPGLVGALAYDELKLSSFAFLIYSLFLFMVVYSYSKYFFSVDSKNYDVFVKIIDIIFLCLIFFSIIEINFYTDFCNFRSIYYGNYFECQVWRDATLYSFPRPTSFFSEPSNFSRFLSILIGIHFYFSRNYLKSTLWFVVFILLTRSPTILYGMPAVLVIVFSRNEHFSYRLSSGLRYVIFVFFGIFCLFAMIFSQWDRLDQVSSRSEGSFESRIVYPFRYLAEKWERPILGNGPTPIDDIDEFSLGLYIAGGRDWLIGSGYRIGLAPTPVFIASLGVVGCAIFVFGAGIALGSNGLLMIFVFLMSNMVNVGVNSPSMYAPSAILLALTEMSRLRASKKAAH